VLQETGTVVAIDADGLWVETLKQSSCAKCSAKYGCGKGLEQKLSPKSQMTFIKAYFDTDKASDSWCEGDIAVLAVHEHALVLGALIAYGTPLLGMLFGAIVGSAVTSDGSDFFSVVGAVVGILMGGLLVKLHSYLTRGDHFYRAQVVGKALASSLQ